MRKIIVFGLLSLFFLNAYAKKDPQAWKQEKQLESQFQSLKSNVSYWDGYFMFKDAQLNEFHQSVMDTVVGLEQKIVDNNKNIVKLDNELVVLSQQLAEKNKSLEESLGKEGSLITLGIQFDKTAFPPLMYGIIIFLILVTVVAFVLFLRSNSVTKETEKRHNELADKLENQKKSSLSRETNLNRELKTERNKNAGTL